MDRVTISERGEERERIQREMAASEQASAAREEETAARELQDEIERGRERGWRAGWGDLRSWAWIFFFAFIVMGAMWLACVLLTGSGTQTAWHLGFPPTRPD